ncbi:MAG: HD domain-containing protein [Desulfuromonadales bacterium]
MNMLLLSISAAVGCWFAVYGTRTWMPKATPLLKQDDPLEITRLSDLSYLWIDDEVEIKDASNLWREQRRKKRTNVPRPAFQHKEIEQFFSEMIEQRSYINGVRRDLIIRILTLLDQEGDCPSVVRKHKDEAERIYSDDSYALLETVPLYRHTLAVARNFIAKADQEALLADMILIALAHDIGKIPSYHDSMYSSGDHPIIAGLILKGIPEFMSLPNREDINRAVTGHHLMKCDNILSDGLKQSDHEARQAELAELYAEVRELKQRKPEHNGGQTASARVDAERNGSCKTVPPVEERDHPLGFNPAKEKFMPTTIDIPDWFDADAIVASLKKRINVVESTSKGEQWSVISTHNGLIYVNPNALWETIKEVSNYDPVVYASEGFESEKRNLMFTVVSEMARTRNALATDHVADGYYTSQVSIITGGGKRVPYLLIPFTAEAFGVLPSALEELKTPQLKRMVKEIKPKNKEVEQCVGR